MGAEIGVVALVAHDGCGPRTKVGEDAFDKVLQRPSLLSVRQSTDTSIEPLSGPKAGQIALIPAIAGRDRRDRLAKSLPWT